MEREVVTITGGVGSVAEEQILQECNEWVQEQGLHQGESMYKLADTTMGTLMKGDWKKPGYLLTGCGFSEKLIRNIEQHLPMEHSTRQKDLF